VTAASGPADGQILLEYPGPLSSHSAGEERRAFDASLAEAHVTSISPADSSDWPDWDTTEEQDSEPGPDVVGSKVIDARESEHVPVNVCAPPIPPRPGTLFATGAVQGCLCPMFIDTGSSVTLLSEWFATVELGVDPETFLPVGNNDSFVGAAGESLSVVGSLILPLIIGAAYSMLHCL